MEVPTEKTLIDKGTLTEPIICTLCNRPSPQADEEHQEPQAKGGLEISTMEQGDANLKRSASPEQLEPLKKPKIGKYFAYRRFFYAYLLVSIQSHKTQVTQMSHRYKHNQGVKTINPKK